MSCVDDEVTGWTYERPKMPTPEEHKRLLDACQSWLRIVERKHVVDYTETANRYWWIWDYN